MSDDLSSMNLRELADRFLNQRSVSACPAFESTARKVLGPSIMKTSARFGQSDPQPDEDCGWGGPAYGPAARGGGGYYPAPRAPAFETARSGLLDTRSEEECVWRGTGYGLASPEPLRRASVPRASVNGPARVDDRALMETNSSRIDLAGPKVRMDTTHAFAGAEKKDEESEGKNSTFHDDIMHVIKKHSQELLAKDAVFAENAKLKAELERASIRIKELERTEKIVEGIRRMRVSVGTVTGKSDFQKVAAFVQDLDEVLAGKSVHSEAE